MATIVEYTLSKPPLNAYPRRIVSPSSPSSCCTEAMVLIGKRETDGPWRYQYKRCRVCGRSRAVYRDFQLCRLCMRQLALKGELPGVTKASW